MICKATVFTLLASGNAQKKGKSMDNRDNVENMLNKLLKVNKLNFDTSQLLQFGCWLQLANEDAWIVSNKGLSYNIQFYYLKNPEYFQKTEHVEKVLKSCLRSIFNLFLRMKLNC
jgi:hypothetical protein